MSEVIIKDPWEINPDINDPLTFFNKLYEDNLIRIEGFGDMTYHFHFKHDLKGNEIIGNVLTMALFFSSNNLNCKKVLEKVLKEVLKKVKCKTNKLSYSVTLMRLTALKESFK